MLFKWLKKRAIKRQRVENIYKQAAHQARDPYFYKVFLVPDSITGRYELLCLHIYLILERLREEDDQREVSQLLTEMLVKELERAYRDSGFQDLSIPKNIKKLIAGFFERAEAYKSGIRKNSITRLSEVISTYIYARNTVVDEHVNQLAVYMLAANNHLKSIPITDIEQGKFVFISPNIEIS